MSRIRFSVGYSFLALALVADRTLKHFFVHHPAVSYGGDFFISFRLAMNPGIAFGIRIVPALITSAILIATLVLMWWWVYEYTKKSYSASLCIMMMIVGAISNVYDRFLFGAVVDYIDVQWFTILNIADAMITLGAFFLIIIFWYQERHHKALQK